MKTVLITGANGFLGKNLLTALRRHAGDFDVRTHVAEDPVTSLLAKVRGVDVVFHLAGANRPPDESAFDLVNRGFTESLIEEIERGGAKCKIVFASSTQVGSDNPYGKSKEAAEILLNDHAERTGNVAKIYRLPNLFGKWCKPKYNSVVATFCYQLARSEEITITNPGQVISLAYVDSVVEQFLVELDQSDCANQADSTIGFGDISEQYDVTVGELARRLRDISSQRNGFRVPNQSDQFGKYLYSTYLSYLPTTDFSRKPILHTDERGWLFELAKSDAFGQIFVSTTAPGVTRGNHYHDTKVEKFCVVKGEGLIRFRHLISEEVRDYPVSENQIEVVDIPPGYTHSIENTGTAEMLVLFWASEIFDSERPDTYAEPV